MLKTTHFWVLTILGIAAVILAVVNMVLYEHNRTTQLDVNSRQAFIQQTMQLESLYREIVKALADWSVKNKDPELANLLGTQGITITRS